MSEKQLALFQTQASRIFALKSMNKKRDRSKLPGLP
jgi:hypothetical protein